MREPDRATRRESQCRRQSSIIVDYYHGAMIGLPELAGQLGATYAIPIIYVPLLMITHIAAFYLLARPQPELASAS